MNIKKNKPSLYVHRRNVVVVHIKQPNRFWFVVLLFFAHFEFVVMLDFRFVFLSLSYVHFHQLFISGKYIFWISTSSCTSLILSDSILEKKKNILSVLSCTAWLRAKIRPSLVGCIVGQYTFIFRIKYSH